MARAECTICGVGFRAEDLFEGDDGLRCPRCYALTAGARDGRERSDAAAGDGDARFTAESLEALAAGSEPESRAPESQAPGAPPIGRTGSSDRESGEPEGEPTGGRARRLAASIREWAAGRNGWVRAPVLLWMAWILVHYWSAPWYSTVFKGIDLAIHEIGHILWAPLGEFMGFAGGTLTQLLAPVAVGIGFVRQRDWFAVSIAVCWLGINCFEIVEYAGDALTRQLPLVSPSTAMPIHDWAYMLGELGILHRTDAVAAGWLWAGRVIMTAGLVFGGWVVWEMGNSRQRTTNN